MWARIHLIPVMQAEEDRDLARRYYADRAREKELLGTELKVYHGDRSVLMIWAWKRVLTGPRRFVRPTFAVTPATISK